MAELYAMDIAVTGAQAATAAVANIANNIANANTVSFKSGVLATVDLPYYTERRPGGAVDMNSNAIVPTSVQYGGGTAVSAIIRSQQQGAAINTGSWLDMMIDGPGYFVLQSPDGRQVYTRDGRFTIDPELNQIVTDIGYVVSPGITIPTNYRQIQVRNDGMVMVAMPDNPELVELGQLEMANFVNPAGLELQGNNIIWETDSSGAAILGIPGQDNFGIIMSGWLEASNVEPVTEMTNLIQAQRGYEMNIKVITVSDEMMERITDV